MSKIVIVYWTGSGNTEAMAHAVEEGAQSAGAEVSLNFVSDISADEAASFDHIALGCPAMGNEQLEEYEFEPFFEELLPQLQGKKVVIFGSYSWNEGDWIQLWKDRLNEAGVELVAEPVKAYSYPEDDVLEACKALGESLANA
ncbi:flavodoxin [Dialister micraerophilus]|uniref:flavodoxin n=1 Tax=Dialister micraerophilus TaxID=309120 RepID=UPI0023F18AEA|nr:flavodoxin [Dialister micraerophilus]